MKPPNPMVGEQDSVVSAHQAAWCSGQMQLEVRRADVVPELEPDLVERPHLSEAEFMVQGVAGRIRLCHNGNDDMDMILAKQVEKSDVEPGPEATAGGGIVEVDRRLAGAPIGRPGPELS